MDKCQLELDCCWYGVLDNLLRSKQVPRLDSSWEMVLGWGKGARLQPLSW